jgi:hypothetical protein
MRAFAGLELGRDAIPDETTILNFRHPHRRSSDEADRRPAAVELDDGVRRRSRRLRAHICGLRRMVTNNQDTRRKHRLALKAVVQLASCRCLFGSWLGESAAGWLLCHSGYLIRTVLIFADWVP